MPGGRRCTERGIPLPHHGSAAAHTEQVPPGRAGPDAHVRLGHEAQTVPAPSGAPLHWRCILDCQTGGGFLVYTISGQKYCVIHIHLISTLKVAPYVMLLVQFFVYHPNMGSLFLGCDKIRDQVS